MRQGADNPELREKGDTTGAFKLRGRPGQVRADPGQRDLRGVRLEDHQVSFQLLEGQAALLVETSGREEGSACCQKHKGDVKNVTGLNTHLSAVSAGATLQFFCHASHVAL